MPYIIDPIVAETVAVWKGVELCRDIGFPHIMLEGDALELIFYLRCGKDV
jgi:hypothetical protein